MSWYDPRDWDLGRAGAAAATMGMSEAGGLRPIADHFGLTQGPDDAPDELKNVHLPGFEEDRARLGGMLNGQSAFAGSEWGSLISQLQARASGEGPSIAGNAYKQASQDSMNNLASLSQNSASPGAARQAILQQGRINQGMAQGYGSAALQEQQMNEGALAQALGARDQINSQAFQGILGQQLGLSRGELAAMQGNQQFYLGNAQIAQQSQAARLQAISSLLAGLGKIGKPG